MLAQCASTSWDEIAAALALPEGRHLRVWVVTGEAKFTQKAIAKKVIEQGSDYVLTTKANQPTLCDDIVAPFNDPQVVTETITTAPTRARRPRS